jgi:hypothetical protein
VREYVRVEMDAVFADDSGQQKTTRPGMGKLVAVGGIHIPSVEVRPLEAELDAMASAIAGVPSESGRTLSHMRGFDWPETGSG